MVTAAASGKSPSPVAKPIAAVAQRLAAVVMPLTLSFSAQIVPAPMKPIPATTPPATCAGCPPKLADIIVKRQEPKETSMCVRKPAGRWACSRSIPTMAPRATAKSKLSSASRVSRVGMREDYAS